MSHFSIIATNFQDLGVLEKSLADLGLVFQRTKNSSSIVIKNNGFDFSFQKTGKNFVLVADADFWYQAIPFEIFLQKLQCQYNYNKILGQVEKHGFFISEEVETNIGVKSLVLEKWT